MFAKEVKYSTSKLFMSIWVWTVLPCYPFWLRASHFWVSHSSVCGGNKPEPSALYVCYCGTGHWCSQPPAASTFSSLEVTPEGSHGGKREGKNDWKGREEWECLEVNGHWRVRRTGVCEGRDILKAASMQRFTKVKWSDISCWSRC